MSQNTAVSPTFGNLTFMGNRYSNFDGTGNRGSVIGNRFLTLWSTNSELQLSRNNYADIRVNNSNLTATDCPHMTFCGTGGRAKLHYNRFADIRLFGTETEVDVSGSSYAVINVENLILTATDCPFSKLSGTGKRVKLRACRHSTMKFCGTTTEVEASANDYLTLNATDCKANLTNLKNTSIKAGPNSDVVATNSEFLNIIGPAQGTIVVKGVKFHTLRPSAKVFDDHPMNYMKFPRHIYPHTSRYLSFVTGGRRIIVDGSSSITFYRNSGGGDERTTTTKVSSGSDEEVGLVVDYCRSVEIDGSDNNNRQYKVGIFDMTLSPVNADVQQLQLSEADFQPNSLEIKVNLPSEVIVTGQSRNGGLKESLGIWAAEIQNVLQEAGKTTITINNKDKPV